MASVRGRAVLIALGGLLAACNALSGVNDFGFDGRPASTDGGAGGEASTSSTGGAGGAPTGGAGGLGGSGGSGGAGVGGIAPTTCGDGAVDVGAGEHCDDGNTQSGDGCAADCTYELSDACPTVELHLGDAPITFTGTTADATPHTGASCGGQNARDYIFRIRATRSGTFSATLLANYNALLWARLICLDAGTFSLGCDNAAPVGISFDVTADLVFFLAVDGNNSASGAFSLELMIQ